MKVSIIILAICISTPAFANDSFCHGFEQGYATGYKQTSNTSLDPSIPICPLQPLKRFNDPNSDFEHGYIIGLQQGMNLNQFQKGMDSRFKDLIGSYGFGGGLNPFQQGQQQALQLQQQQQALEIQKENFFIKVQQDNFNEDWNLKLK